MGGFEEGEGIRVFEELRRRRLVRFRPNILAGPVGVLRALAEGAEDRGAPVPRVSRAVIAFSLPLHGFLSEEARDLFWRVFQVPVFGQLLGFEGEMLAWECEAHEGLHIDDRNAVFELDEHSGGDRELLLTSLVNLRTPVLRFGTGLTGIIEHSTCGCGLNGPRLLGLRRRSLSRPQQTAVFAASASCAAD
jgi:phenylacetate-coenzyme A ligase PaaK-like adenylate-forming protein